MLLAILLLAVTHLVLAWLGRNGGVGWGEDDAQYLSLARDLTHFSYHERWDVAAPFHARYPPVFPLLLAIVGVPTGWNVQVLLFATALSSAFTIALFADAVRRRFGNNIALACAIPLTFNPMWLQDAGILMAEVPFKFFLVAALWGLSREEEGSRYSLLAGACTILAALTRTAGLAFVCGLFAYWIWKRRFRWAALFAVAATLTVGAWLGWISYSPDAQSHRLYVADIKQLTAKPSDGVESQSLAIVWFHRIVRRSKVFSTVMVPFVLAFRTWSGTIIDNVAWLVFAISTGTLGLLVMLRRWLPGAAMLGSYMGLMMVWTWAVERFLSPVAPLLYLAMVLGAVWLLEFTSAKLRKPTLLAMTALLAWGPISQSASYTHARLACDRQHPEESLGCYSDDDVLYFRMAKWVRDSIPRDAIVFANKDAAFATHSGHRVVNQLRALEEDSLSLVPYLREHGVQYAVVGPVGMRIIEHSQLLEKACNDLILVKEFPKASAVLRVRGKDEATDGGRACHALQPWTKRRPVEPDN